MKQRKSVQYLLIILSIIIYGIIVSKVWSYFNTKDDFRINTRFFQQKELKFSPEKDTFSLNLNYTDPFTGAKNVSRNNNISRPSHRRKKTSAIKDVEEKIIEAPNIIYQGYSINNNKINRVRLQIDGKGITFQLHEQKLDILLSSITKDSIIVQKDGQLFVFHRKET